MPADAVVACGYYAAGDNGHGDGTSWGARFGFGIVQLAAALKDGRQLDAQRGVSHRAGCRSKIRWPTPTTCPTQKADPGRYCRMAHDNAQHALIAFQFGIRQFMGDESALRADRITACLL